ncbi:MAG TPA: hypothetical protein VGL93_09295 [Streptosporangiaceae bacterium]|jgi:hypothetical protein
MGGRLVVTITADDVGRRVTIRRALPDGRLGDVVGNLEAWSDGLLRVRRRDGSVVEVAEAAMVAAKIVPPAPEPRRR